MQKYTKIEILNFLRKQNVMNISFTDGKRPMASVVLFAVDGDFTFYFAAHTNSYKAQALMKNNMISFTVWEHLQMLFQADGVVHKANDMDVRDILVKLARSSVNVENFWPPILRTDPDTYTVFVVEPVWMRVLDLTSLKIGESITPFQEVEIN